MHVHGVQEDNNYCYYYKQGAPLTIHWYNGLYRTMSHMGMIKLANTDDAMSVATNIIWPSDMSQRKIPR